MTIYNASKLLHRCQISLRKILWITTNCDAKNCSCFWKPEPESGGGGGGRVGGLCDLVSKPLKSFHFPEISVTIWNTNFWRHVWHNAVTIYKKTFLFILNTKTFSALFSQLVKTCCNKLLTQETLMLLFYIYKESLSSLSNRVWKAKCKYIFFYRGTCRQVDKKTFFISAI